MLTALLTELHARQSQLRQLIMQVHRQECYLQYHEDLSPLAWHLGHCVYTELYWLNEVLCQSEAIDADLKTLYIPELSVKTKRAQRLPDYATLIQWSQTQQSACRQQLAQLDWDAGSQALLQNYYLLRFLIQHYAQHLEISRLILAQRQLQQADKDSLSAPLSASTVNRASVCVAAGEYPIGDSDAEFHYDNEVPVFHTALNRFNIAVNPATHGEYAGFVADNGYDQRALWSAAGWQWRQQHGITAPMHWQQNAAGRYCVLNVNAAETINSGSVLFGISHYEASAFANWAGARLAHEYEWETARRLGLLQAVGRSWEWCANAFHPYAGFRAYPYAGYSLPWFDGQHFVLRGASLHSLDCVRRPSFRNYYQADKRYIQAGLRLCFE